MLNSSQHLRCITCFLLIFCLARVLPALGQQAHQCYPYQWRDSGNKARVLFVGGGDFHDTVTYAAILRPLMEETGKYYVQYSEDYDSLTRLDTYDVIVVAAMIRQLTPQQEQGLVEAVRNGKPLLALHGATASFKTPENFGDPELFDKHPDFFTMLGAQFVQHPPIHEFKVAVRDRSHAVMQGIADFSVTDELYHFKDLQPDIHVLLSTEYAGIVIPQAWVKQYGKGKVFYLALGHDERSLGLDLYKRMFMQSLSWLQE